MISPPFLNKGDTIAIAAPARKVTPEELQPAIDLFTSWGVFVSLPPNLFGNNNQFSGTDEERASDLQSLLDNPTIKAIIFARGGYGTVKIIDKLDFSTFIKDPKWIVGYSDITVLHSHIHHNFGIETLHAAMPVNFKTNDEASLRSFDQLRKALFGELISYQFDCNNLSIPGEAHGILTGGNLSILYSLLSSESDIDTTGKILFIEDIDEYLYHIDRMMMALKRAGKLENLAGLAVGGFTDMKDNEIPYGKNALEIIKDIVKEYKYPVAFGIPAGHQVENLPLVLGRDVHLSVTDQSYIRFSNPLEKKGIKRYSGLFKPALFVIAGFVVLYILYSFLLGRL